MRSDRVRERIKPGRESTTPDERALLDRGDPVPVETKAFVTKDIVEYFLTFGVSTLRGSAVFETCGRGSVSTTKRTVISEELEKDTVHGQGFHQVRSGREGLTYHKKFPVGGYFPFSQ